MVEVGSKAGALEPQALKSLHNMNSLFLVLSSLSSARWHSQIPYSNSEEDSVCQDWSAHISGRTP